MSTQHKRRGKKARLERQIRAEKREEGKQPTITLDIDPDAIINALARKESSLGRDMTDEEAIDFITNQILAQLQW